MLKSLVNSKTDRINLLNNPFAVEEIKSQLGIKTHYFDNQYYVTYQEVANFYDVDTRTLRRYLEENKNELKDNGYRLIAKNDFDRFMAVFGADINVRTTRINKLSLFSFRAFLNLGMLLKQSEVARTLRKILLDIAMDVINKKAGGDVKYINQRDENYLTTLYLGEKYNKKLKEALNNYVDLGNFKYAIFGNRIYQIIFKEHASEYRKLLNLHDKEKIKDTLYSEVLNVISTFQVGLADRISKKAKEEKKGLTVAEINEILDKLANDPLIQPSLELARIKMASFDSAFRKIEHKNLSKYVGTINEEDYQRFLGKKSMELQERIKKQQDIFKRLKDK